jgi:hypothetical protein
MLAGYSRGSRTIRPWAAAAPAKPGRNCDYGAGGELLLLQRLAIRDALHLCDLCHLRRLRHLCYLRYLRYLRRSYLRYLRRNFGRAWDVCEG